VAKEITAQLVKELRDITGVGMGACKKALVEADGDLDLAIDNLRKAGMASAVKKEGRETNEGQIGFNQTSEGTALIEINAETDFVVKNDRFQEFVTKTSAQAAAQKLSSLEGLLKAVSTIDSKMTVDEYRAYLVQTIGENIQIKRTAFLPKKGSQGVYAHLGGKIVVVVDISSEGMDDVAREVAMHCVAAQPTYLSPSDVPSSVVEKEKEIFRDQIAGKPEQVKEKIVEGKLQSFYKEQCLLNQPYIKDDKKSIQEFVASRNKDAVVTSFTFWRIGA